MNTIVIVDGELFDRAPKALQEYVTEWFKKKEILGKRCYVGIRCITSDYHELKREGWAPSHHLDLRRYQEGLNGLHINEWIRRHEGNGIWTIYGAGHSSDNSIDCG